MNYKGKKVRHIAWNLKGEIKNQVSPPPNAQGIGTDILIRWGDNWETWHDAGDTELQWEENHS